MRYSLFIIATILFFSSTAMTVEASLPAPVNISGEAWSSNIGWLSMQGPGYQVRVNTNYTISGFAWSSNIGWVMFGGLSGCPGGGNCNARIDPTTNQVVGWARACAVTTNADCSGSVSVASGGWDGWISLNCSNTGNCGTNNYQLSANNGSINGYAWGGDVVGWVSFSAAAVTYPVPCSASISCQADLSGSRTTSQWCHVTLASCPTNYQCSVSNPSQCEVLPIIASLSVLPPVARSRETVDLTWTTTNATNCTLFHQNPGGVNVGPSRTGTSGTMVESGPIAGLTIFRLYCTDVNNANNREVASSTVNLIPEIIER